MNNLNQEQENAILGVILTAEGFTDRLSIEDQLLALRLAAKQLAEEFPEINNKVQEIKKEIR